MSRVLMSLRRCAEPGLVWLGAVVMFAGMTAVALPAGEQELPTGVTVSATAGVPGAEVEIPVYLASAQGVQPGEIVLRIVFPRDSLTFTKAERDGAELPGLTLTSALVPRGDLQNALLEIKLKLDGPPSIPDGPLVRIHFDISATVETGSEIPLKASVEIKAAGDDSVVTPVKAYDGKVTVTGEAIFSCFFYMH